MTAAGLVALSVALENESVEPLIRVNVICSCVWTVPKSRRVVDKASVGNPLGGGAASAAALIALNALIMPKPNCVSRPAAPTSSVNEPLAKSVSICAGVMVELTARMSARTPAT